MFLRVARRAWYWETSQPPTAINAVTTIATAATTCESTSPLAEAGAELPLERKPRPELEPRFPNFPGAGAWP